MFIFFLPLLHHLTKLLHLFFKVIPHLCLVLHRTPVVLYRLGRIKQGSRYLGAILNPHAYQSENAEFGSQYLPRLGIIFSPSRNRELNSAIKLGYRFRNAVSKFIKNSLASVSLDNHQWNFHKRNVA